MTPLCRSRRPKFGKIFLTTQQIRGKSKNTAKIDFRLMRLADRFYWFPKTVIGLPGNKTRWDTWQVIWLCRTAIKALKKAESSDDINRLGLRDDR
jgi:hypothetical protein